MLRPTEESFPFLHPSNILNAAGVNLSGFEHIEMLLNVEDRMRAGFTQREIDEIRRQEDRIRADAADKAAVA